MSRTSSLLTSLIAALHGGEAPTLLRVQPSGVDLDDVFWPGPFIDWPTRICLIESLSETVADLQSRAEPVHIISPWGSVVENGRRDLANRRPFPQTVLASLSSNVQPTQSLTILLPPNSISPRSRSDLRRQLLESWDIGAVVTGAGGLEQVHASFPWVLLSLVHVPGKGDTCSLASIPKSQTWRTSKASQRYLRDPGARARADM